MLEIREISGMVNAGSKLKASSVIREIILRWHQPTPLPYLPSSPNRRVHVTQATVDALGGAYQLEPGEGHSRNAYLRDKGVESYFIVPHERRRKVRLLFGVP